VSSDLEAFLARRPESGMHLGLERIEAALDALGRPQAAFPTVHVAGTNGKGSTCAFLASAFAAEGKRVGLYTSPHLVSFRERIRIGGKPIAEDQLEASWRRLRDAGDFVRDPEDPRSLSYFEVATALAFDAFAHAGVEVAVMEVGLGGRLDATNVRGKDLRAAVVTRIGVDHVDQLGSDPATIAREKGAIARPHRPLVVGAQREAAARAALLAQGRELGAEVIDVEAATRVARAAEGLSYRGPRWALDGLALGLAGAHQVENARTALAVLEHLGVSPEAARAGLSAARWPGRLHVLAERPLVVADGAHNPDGARALAEAWRELWPTHRPHLVFAAMVDKAWAQVLESLLPLAETVHVCPVRSSRRTVEPERLAAAASGRPTYVHPTARAALDAASRSAGREGAVLVTGSLYLVGEVLALVGWTAD